MSADPSSTSLLTSETTVATLCGRGELCRWESSPPYVLGLIRREIFYSGGWLGFYNRLPDKQIKGLGPKDATPAAQIRKFLDAYATGQPPRTVDDFGKYPSWKYMKNSVWEIRAGVTRSFGWFVKANVLVLVEGALKDELVDQNGKEVDKRYRAFKKSVLVWQEARSLKLSEVSDEEDHKKLIT